MATIVQTPAGTWKALVRKQGWPTATKTFRTKRDASDWARKAEDEMVQGVYVDRAQSARMTFDKALSRYLSEVVPTKKPAMQETDRYCAEPLHAAFGKYSLAASAWKRECAVVKSQAFACTKWTCRAGLSAWRTPRTIAQGPCRYHAEQRRY